jgi:UDP-N-acetylmuramate: L-alanyl-gamma-D-glutamyl-meso-diaminopimelate ligase
VVEGDEYDCAFFDKRPKFVHYLPDIAVIGNVEFDHADIYPDLAAVETAFRRLLSVLPRRGRLIAGVESPAVRAARRRLACRGGHVRLAEGAPFRRGRPRAAARGTSFRLVADGTDRGRFVSPMAGEHNVRNALAALAPRGRRVRPRRRGRRCPRSAA